MIRLRYIGLACNRQFDGTATVIVPFASAFVARGFGWPVGVVGFLAMTAAAWVISRRLEKAADRWVREEFEEVGVDYEAVGN
ncbi:hypothetical protein [Mesorhizobium sp. A623]